MGELTVTLERDDARDRMAERLFPPSDKCEEEQDEKLREHIGNKQLMPLTVTKKLSRSNASSNSCPVAFATYLSIAGRASIVLNVTEEAHSAWRNQLTI